MKMILLVSALMITVISFAQTSKEMQYVAYMKASKAMWERSISLAEKESGAESFEKAIAMYGLLSNTMATQDQDTFDENVDQMIDLLKEITEENPEWGEPKAVLSSVYGLVMAYSPMKGMLYGSRSSSLVSDAMKVQPQSPLVQKLFGGSKLYTPEMFGGSPQKAVIAYSKSVELFEKEDSNANWMYLDALVGLAMAYEKTGKMELAKQTAEKALDIEPEYEWAKSILASLNK